MNTPTQQFEWLPTNPPCGEVDYDEARDYYYEAIRSALVTDSAYTFEHADLSPIEPKDIVDWIATNDELYALQIQMMITKNQFEAVGLRSKIMDQAIDGIAQHWAVEEVCALTD